MHSFSPAVAPSAAAPAGDPMLHRAVPGSAIQVSPKCVHASIPATVKELVEDISAYFKG